MLHSIRNSPRFALRTVLTLTVLGLPLQAASPISACGFTITGSGTYTLDTDLGPCPASGINIAASNVTLNLGGHKITGQGPAWVGINVNPAFAANPLTVPRLSHVSIQGPGLVQLFATGILFTAVDYAKVDRVTSAGHLDGLFATDSPMSISLTNNVFAGNRRLGISLSSSRNGLIVNNDVSGNGYTQFPPFVITGGILLTNGSNNELRQNTVNGNNNAGIYLSAETGSNVQNNTVNGNQTIGILDSGTQSAIMYNTSEGNMSLDLSETTTSCGSNRWHNNTFFTSNQACIH